MDQNQQEFKKIIINNIRELKGKNWKHESGISVMKHHLGILNVKNLLDEITQEVQYQLYLLAVLWISFIRSNTLERQICKL